ncbi:TolC family protein [Chitinophaga sp. 212800010-3]|uniref:TolC family protein n=1 Tax=unclassified Chitinophaga TaxID=2619133 RepID=UPI002DE7D105|nr:TolC family protein [Chitinophaga sp. 212800010-3]
MLGALLFIFFSIATQTVCGQRAGDSSASLSLRQCIDYALQHQPALQQSLIRTNIVKASNAISLSGWYPQVGVTANLNHYLQRPTTLSNINGVETPIKTSVINTSTPGVGVTQAIFTPSLVYAAKAAPLNLKAAEQGIDSTKIELVANISKSFYSLLLTLQQIDVLKEDTARLGESMRTAYHQYVGGIVDETDYEQATITLNTSMVQLKQASESIWPQYAVLKQLMGYPSAQQFNVSYDSTEMVKNIEIDTTEQLQYEKRIELKQLTVQKDLQHRLTDYYKKYSFLPTLSAFYNYNGAFQNNDFAKLYNTAYPNSMIGLTLSLPVFTGLARIHNLRRSSLQEQMLSWSEVSLKSVIYSEYATALSNYRSNIYNMRQMKDNVDLAKRVYFVVDLQYKQGIVPYLNVITAETNLRTSALTYLNALFQVLSSKIDWQKAMGEIPY